MSLLVNSVWPRNVHVADRAERWVRTWLEDLVAVPAFAAWPGWSRRAVRALPRDGSILGWSKMRAVFGPEWAGRTGAFVLVERLVHHGLIERVFWHVKTGEEVPEEQAWPAMNPSAGRAIKAWARQLCVGYRLPRSGDVGDEKGAAA
jgi:hypothetical protein